MKTRPADLPGAQRLGVKCPRCGSDAWGIQYRVRIVCRVCEPEARGPRAWPRATVVGKHGFRFHDTARIARGDLAIVYREPYGYRIVLHKKRGAR